MQNSLPEWILEILRTPEDGLPLTLERGALAAGDGRRIAMPEDIPDLAYPREISGDDAEMEQRYQWLAPFYDFSERVLGYLLTGVAMTAGRREIVSLLGLQSGQRLLEVSPGPGVFQPLLRAALGRDAEAAALDLSQAMLRQCRKQHARENFVLIRGNAAYLPFADASFDALFHFGGLNLFNEPERALTEFVRVVRPGGIVAWGDEEMSPNYRYPLGRWLLPKINPGFLRVPPPPPAGLTGIVKHEVYCGLGYLYVARRAAV